ncbi:HTH-type transcriptional regulator ChbR [Chryseobacterium sp. MOF25P]|uniref:helix-turn-helix domain-containing protein n=1 Tax=unclassified Chryseobacterium TaxID=2593645 RepID=UPI000805928F|nr:MULTISPECIES: helix-turn-helix domain-containing protein [unclassified Chryseobacterium]OBW42361.1 HTH-type transcriptional regulator ChbR [Chryseobacterium sp. MOF25P]OBW43725.1 HTH-type transcriptional regulator ChbR [Chryseobacterium sp. BGARF1]
MTLLFFFSALGAFNGFLLSLYFAINAKKKNFTNYFLSLLLLVLSIRIIKSVFFYFTPHISNIFIQIGLSACIMIGPLLYLYLNSYSEKKANWKIHVIPYLVLMTALGIFYPYVEHQAIWSRWIVCGIYLQWFMYIILSFKYIFPIIQKFKKKENLKNLDVWFLSIYLGVLFIWLAYTIAAYTSYIVGALSFTFVLYLIVLLLIFRNSNESTTFFEEKEKYKNREIDKKTLQLIEQKFSLILDKELFLNPNFTLENAAKELKITKHILSQYVNEILGKSFSSLIKEYRVEKAKQLLETETNYTIESLGYDSGFNSKSTFFTAFKKITGLTPAEYQKSQSK